MKAEIKREMNKSYLVLDREDNGYQSEMICKNLIEGLVPSKIVEWDQKQYLYYDISSKKPIDKVFAKRKIGLEEIKAILYAIDNLQKISNLYLLEPQNVLTEPEYIFWDYCNDSINWILYPSRKSSSFNTLAEFILEKVDTEDTEAVKVAYGLYKQIKEDNIGLENLYELLENPENNVVEDETKIDVEESQGQTNVRNESKNEKIKDKLIKNLKIRKKKEDTDTEDWFRKEKEMISDNIHLEEEKGTALLFKEAAEYRRLISQNERFQDIVLTSFPVLIGSRSDSVDCVIKDKSVSRLHAQIGTEGGRVTLIDLNSTNGTYRNQERVSGLPTELIPGDEIRFGNVEFKYF